MLDVFNLPGELRGYNGTVFDFFEGLHVLLGCLAYPCRYGDLILRFARPVPHLCMIANLVAEELFVRFGYLLRDLHQLWLSHSNPQIFAMLFMNKGTKEMKIQEQNKKPSTSL